MGDLLWPSAASEAQPVPGSSSRSPPSVSRSAHNGRADRVESERESSLHLSLHDGSSLSLASCLRGTVLLALPLLQLLLQFPSLDVQLLVSLLRRLLGSEPAIVAGPGQMVREDSEYLREFLEHLDWGEGTGRRWCEGREVSMNLRWGRLGSCRDGTSALSFCRLWLSGDTKCEARLCS